MKVINLINGASEGIIPTNIAAVAHQQIVENMRDNGMPLRYMSFRRFQNRHWNGHLETLLNEVTVYLVKSSQAGQTIEVNGRKVTVPQDNYESCDFEEAVDLWFRKMQNNNSDELIYGQSVEGYSIYDPFGVYQRNEEGSSVPAEIFIWIDRIMEVNQGTGTWFSEGESSESEPRTCPLVQFAVIMEYAHYLFDPRTYGADIYADFNYDSPLYQYFEAANIVSLARGVMRTRVGIEEITAIDALIARLPEQYAAGGEDCDVNHHYPCSLEFWLMAKVVFDEVILKNLKWAWYRTCCRKDADFRNDVTPFFPKYANNANPDIHTLYISNRHDVICYSDDISFHRSERHWHVCCKAMDYNIQNRVYDKGLFVIKGDLEVVYRLRETECFAVKMRDSQWGIVNREGEFVAPCIYDNVETYIITDMFLVRKDGKEGLINGEGKIVVPVEYDTIGSIDLYAVKVIGSIKAMKMNCLASKNVKSLKGRISIKVTQEGKDESLEIEV